MFRTAFVLAIAFVGIHFALQSTFYTLLLYLWLAYFRPEEWVWNDLIRSLGLSWFVGIYLVGRCVLTGDIRRPERRTFLLLLILADGFLSVMVSGYFPYAWPYWQGFAKAIVVTYLLSSLIQDRSQYRLVLLTIVLSLGFEATKQGWAQLILHPGAKNPNSITFLGDENLVAIGMLMLLPLVLVLAKTAERDWAKWMFRFMAVGVLYRALSTYSRGGFIACLAVGAIYVMRSPHRARSIFGIIVALAITVPAFPDRFWDRMNTITPREEEMDDSMKGRLHCWRVGLSMGNDNPITGVGFNAYEAAYDDYDFLNGAYGSKRAVHSAWVGVLAELGYPGLLLFITNLALALLSCRRVRRHAAATGDEELRTYAIALEASFAAALVGGSFVSFQYNEMMWHFVGLSIALETIAMKPVETLEPEEEMESATVAVSGFR